VSRQEEPVALREPGPQSAPRVVFPPPPSTSTLTTSPTGQSGQTAAPTQQQTAAPTEGPKRVRTVTIRPDGTDSSSRPTGNGANGQPAARGTTHAAQPKANGAATRSGPLSLDPQNQGGRNAMAAVREPAGATSGSSYVVQLSSQRTESEAQASFRALQAKFPNELGSRQPIIRRADLGSKGVVYRTNVGPFATAAEASQFCASYKAAGGQCLVPNN
jgi:hypothetical protein